MADKYYAVKKGVVPGLYESWDDCKKNVLGFPGADFKSFGTLEEAQAYLGQGNDPVEKNSKLLPVLKLKIQSASIAYVDGSFNEATGEYSYGMVFYDGNEITEKNEKFSDEEMAQMRNVAGEIEGAMHAMAFAIEQGIKSLDLYYDYEGIEAWAHGTWQTNKPGTIAYKEYFDG